MDFQALDEHKVMALAHCFARCIVDHKLRVPLLMCGPLGAGKTTFIRYLVEALPGSEQAEISSPSFNILNLYPTMPPVGHFDLYRTSGLGLDADIEEILHDDQWLPMVEWAEYLPAQAYPEVYVTLTWTMDGPLRHIHGGYHGPAAQALLDCVQADFQ